MGESAALAHFVETNSRVVERITLAIVEDQRMRAIPIFWCGHTELIHLSAQSPAERDGERSGELEAAVEHQHQAPAGKPDQQNALHELLDYLAQV